MTLSLASALSIVLFSFVAQSAPKVILVSDIDDTIKVSHVLNQVGKVTRALDQTTPFLGMAQIYQLIVNENPQTTKVVYLSNAPESVAGIPALRFSHQGLLDRNHFPNGELVLREDMFDQSHKIRTLRELIQKEMPDVLILVGDNGEKDVDVYHQATQEFAYLTKMKVVTFIHQLYGSKESSFLPDFLKETGRLPYAEQMGYVTPIEISLKLNDLGLLKQNSVDWMIENVAPVIVAEQSFKWDGLRPLSFPLFKDCSDFRWSFSQPENLRELIEKIEQECN